ncbi:MAG: HEXXH motif-containing putative peptide modification protein [Methylococcaceae bacterium]
MSSVQNLIFSTIKNPSSSIWFPALTKQLVNCGWKAIYQKYGIQKGNYSTEAMLQGRIGNSITATACLNPIIQHNNKPLRLINIYPMPEEIVAMYSYSGSKPYSFETLQNSTVLQCLQESLDILATIPTVYETVSNLVASLHILQPEDDDFDISYSLPNIPFSIFVSVPSKHVKNDALRVAEAILHEAMHLQLTLIEQIVPMIIDTDEKYFSPWKNEHRHPRGVLHAIYVFCVIKEFFELLKRQDISSSSIQFLNERCSVISNQLTEINDFKNCLYFTDAGKTLINRLLFD